MSRRNPTRRPGPVPADGGPAQGSARQDCLRAVQRGDVEGVRALLEAGTAADWRDGDGCSLVFHAIFRRQFAVAEVLLAHGADIDLTDRHSWTPLFWAAFNGHADVVGFLLAHGAEADAPTREGDRPLFIASYKGHAEVVGLLLAGGASPAARDGASGLDALGVARLRGTGPS